jgi:hypothetical protein
MMRAGAGETKKSPAAQVPEPGWRVLRWPGLARPVVLEEGTGLEQELAAVLRGWSPAAETQAHPREPAIACVVRDGHGRGAEGRERLALHSVHRPVPYRGLERASAICALVADLGQAWFGERPGTLALHCGAFRIGGRLVAVSGPPRAGKSTLIARLTAEPGIEVFCDDILPVLEDGRAVALGIAPRLRLPLPDTASVAFRAHVAATFGPRDRRYGFVCAGSIAPHGTHAPLTALVRLERCAAGPARLFAMGRDAALTEVLSRNMAEQETPGGAFARASGMLRGVRTLRLVYADLEDAVALLGRAFGTARGLGACLTAAGAEPGPDRAAPPAAREADFDPDRKVVRTPGVAMRRRGGSAFLWHPGGAAIWQLNPVAHAVWAMLDRPDSARGIATALADVFAGVPERQLCGDVARLIGGLVSAGLARPV